jgi:excisionase family DNA binding protein
MRTIGCHRPRCREDAYPVFRLAGYAPIDASAAALTVARDRRLGRWRRVGVRRAVPAKPDGVALSLDVPGALVEQIAQRAAAILAERGPPAASSPWLDTKSAAAHLACGTDRIHDLVQLGRLTAHRDGRRLLFRREELDAYVEATGGAELNCADGRAQRRKTGPARHRHAGAPRGSPEAVEARRPGAHPVRPRPADRPR